MNFRIQALPSAQFALYFDLSAQELQRRGALLRSVDKRPGFPCRVSLIDALVGEKVLLINYEHHSGPTPFRSSHAIYARQNAEQAHCEVGEIPELFRSRLMSVRGFDREGMLIDADVIDGGQVESAIERMFKTEVAAYLHLHFAKPGCYAARVERA
jgi:hypothetical protein